jgi:hypothetical protein
MYNHMLIPKKYDPYSNHMLLHIIVVDHYQFLTSIRFDFVKCNISKISTI